MLAYIYIYVCKCIATYIYMYIHIWLDINIFLNVYVYKYIYPLHSYMYNSRLEFQYFNYICIVFTYIYNVYLRTLHIKLYIYISCHCVPMCCPSRAPGFPGPGTVGQGHGQRLRSGGRKWNAMCAAWRRCHSPWIPRINGDRLVGDIQQLSKT